MAFSPQTMSSARIVADRAKAMWQGTAQAGFDYLSLIMMLLSFLMENCGKKTEGARKAQLRTAYNAAIANGVDGCIECCMTADRAKKLRKKLARKKGLKTRPLQDAHIFNAICAANVEREATVSAMTSAYENEETEDQEE